MEFDSNFEIFLERIKEVVGELDDESSSYFCELEDTYREECCRSSISLAWGTIMIYLYKLVEKYGFGRWEEKIQSIDDLNNKSDDDVIKYLFGEVEGKSAIINDVTLKNMLRGLKNKRNRASHVNSHKHTHNTINSFLNDALEVIDKIKENLNRKDGFDINFYNNLTPEKYAAFIGKLNKNFSKNCFFEYVLDRLKRRRKEIPKDSFDLNSELIFLNKDMELVLILINNSNDADSKGLVSKLVESLTFFEEDLDYIFILLDLIKRIDDKTHSFVESSILEFSGIMQSVYDKVKNDLGRKDLFNKYYLENKKFISKRVILYIEDCEDTKTSSDVIEETKLKDYKPKIIGVQELTDIQGVIFSEIDKFQKEELSFKEKIKLVKSIDSKIKEYLNFVEWHKSSSLHKEIKKKIQRTLYLKFSYKDAGEASLNILNRLISQVEIC